MADCCRNFGLKIHSGYGNNDDTGTLFGSTLLGHPVAEMRNCIVYFARYNLEITQMIDVAGN